MCLFHWYSRERCNYIRGSPRDFKTYTLNHHFESHLNKNFFLIFRLFNSFFISCAHSKELTSLSIFDLREIRNRWRLYLNNQLNKLLESIFTPKSLFLTITKDIKSLLELLLERAKKKRKEVGIKPKAYSLANKITKVFCARFTGCRFCFICARSDRGLDSRLAKTLCVSLLLDLQNDN